MIPPKDIKPKTEYVKNVMNNERFDKYRNPSSYPCTLAHIFLQF